MSESTPDKHFSGDKASSYDERRAPLAPIYQALYLCADAMLSALPEVSHVLIVGAGTGSELVVLAQGHPGWTFTLVDPSVDMMNVCRQAAHSAGIESRCTFYEGYVDSLPASTAFDGATCLLVSYFILDPAARQAFYASIASRLRPGGHLVNAELSPAVSAPEFPALRDAWVALHQRVGLGMRPDYLGRDVAVETPADIEDMLGRAGFFAPTLFFRTLLIAAWHSRVRSAAQSPGED